MIREGDDGTFTISSRRQHLPGIYDSERSARYAFRFPADALQRLSDRVCRFDRENRAITMDDLRTVKTALQAMLPVIPPHRHRPQRAES